MRMQQVIHNRMYGQGRDEGQVLSLGEKGNLVKAYRCGRCDRKFSSNKDLVRHMRAHTGEKPYKCQYCDKYFSRLDNMTVHQRLKHLQV